MRHQYDTYPEPKRNSIQMHNTLFAHDKQNKAKHQTNPRTNSSTASNNHQNLSNARKWQPIKIELDTTRNWEPIRFFKIV